MALPASFGCNPCGRVANWDLQNLKTKFNCPMFPQHCEAAELVCPPHACSPRKCPIERRANHMPGGFFHIKPSAWAKPRAPKLRLTTKTRGLAVVDKTTAAEQLANQETAPAPPPGDSLAPPRSPPQWTCPATPATFELAGAACVR